MGGVEAAGSDLPLCTFDKVARCRIVRIERRDLGLQPVVVIGDLRQRLAQPLVWNVRLFPDDTEQRLGSLLGNAQALTHVSDSADKRLGGTFDRRPRHLPQLFRRETEIAIQSVIAGITSGSNAASVRSDWRVVGGDRGSRYERSDQGRRAEGRYFLVVSAHAAAAPPAGVPPL
jgi:hypothetical protein